MTDGNNVKMDYENNSNYCNNTSNNNNNNNNNNSSPVPITIQVNTPNQPNPPKKKRKIKLFVILIIIGIVLFILFKFIIFRKKRPQILNNMNPFKKKNVPINEEVGKISSSQPRPQPQLLDNKNNNNNNANSNLHIEPKIKTETKKNVESGQNTQNKGNDSNRENHNLKNGDEYVCSGGVCTLKNKENGITNNKENVCKQCVQTLQCMQKNMLQSTVIPQLCDPQNNQCIDAWKFIGLYKDEREWDGVGSLQEIVNRVNEDRANSFDIIKLDVTNASPKEIFDAATLIQVPYLAIIKINNPSQIDHSNSNSNSNSTANSNLILQNRYMWLALTANNIPQNAQKSFDKWNDESIDIYRPDIYLGHSKENHNFSFNNQYSSFAYDPNNNINNNNNSSYNLYNEERSWAIYKRIIIN